MYDELFGFFICFGIGFVVNNFCFLIEDGDIGLVLDSFVFWNWLLGIFVFFDMFFREGIVLCLYFLLFFNVF